MEETKEQSVDQRFEGEGEGEEKEKEKETKRGSVEMRFGMVEIIKRCE